MGYPHDSRPITQDDDSRHMADPLDFGSTRGLFGTMNDTSPDICEASFDPTYNRFEGYAQS